LSFFQTYPRIRFFRIDESPPLLLRSARAVASHASLELEDAHQDSPPSSWRSRGSGGRGRWRRPGGRRRATVHDDTQWIIIDSNNNPEHLFTTNPFYDALWANNVKSGILHLLLLLTDVGSVMNLLMSPTKTHCSSCKLTPYGRRRRRPGHSRWRQVAEEEARKDGQKRRRPGRSQWRRRRLERTLSVVLAVVLGASDILFMYFS
jgi:hypothetical protein